MEYGIIFEGDESPLVAEISEKLESIGLYSGSEDRLSRELLDALNEYRTANRMTVLDFCDPAVLRALGISARGDEIVTLARYGEANSETEIGCYDACIEVVNESRRLGISLTEAIFRRGNHDLGAEISCEAMSAALLAIIAQ